MRIIAGKFKKFNIRVSSNIEVNPTTDRVKESLFNIMGSNVKGSNLADLFCGFGSVGLEALSRGARCVSFVDKRKECIKIVEKNLTILSKHTNLESGKDFQLYNKKVSDFILIYATLDQKFDVIFMDPPYESRCIEKILLKIRKYDILMTSGLLVLETSYDKKVPFNIEGFEVVRDEVYGKSKLLFFK